MSKRLIYLLFTVLSFSQSTLFAQKITVNARLDSTVLWIGNQANLSFEVSQPPKQKVVMPIFSDSIIGGLEMVAPVKTDTVLSPDGQVLVTQRYVVTAFEDSLLYIPPFPFVLNGDTVWSKSLSLKVIQPFKVDTAANTIADIKPVFEPKFDWWGLIKIILIVLLVIALLVFLYFKLKKYFDGKQGLIDAKPKVMIPPHVLAISKLDKIKTEKPWQQGRFKEYHTEITDVLREYIEGTYNVRSLEMTSEEILDELYGLKLEQRAAYDGLSQILKLADLVKFAKWTATPDEHEMSLMNSYLFVNQTKVEEIKTLEEIKEEVSKEEK